ncbi:alpha/beta fold hydrolase [Herbaspirillum autotrophicum]|uniref:alpha/beta fold hydrolase n=1 Tax=Herbaspirillum autotrophicum TaxID=180195 RepID=UPI00067B1E36|nr:alpha/beta hydrolase [Herbaspirillum autotrophicum]
MERGKHSGKVHTEGADIAYDCEGQGPLLLLVVGGNGDSRRYIELSSRLADSYTVVRYDRRASCRSSGDAAADLDMAQQGRDAAALIRALAAGPAYVFGNSGGASIALALTEGHPELVRGLVVHEPPVMRILPDADQQMALVDGVYATYQAQGTGPAMRQFAMSLIGFSPSAAAPGDQGGNMDRFMAHEYLLIGRYLPDLGKIRRDGVPVIACAGSASLDAYYARTAKVAAEILACPYVEIAGHHLAFVTDPDLFATELRSMLHRLSATELPA